MEQIENKNVHLCGLNIFGGGYKEWLCEIDRRMRGGRQTAVYTPGAVMLENAMRDPCFHAVLSRGDMHLPDGMGVVLAARLLGQHIEGRLSGIDAAKGVLALAARRGWRVFLFGGQKGVAKRAAARLREKYPTLVICGTCHGYLDGEGQERLLRGIEKTRADVVLVCLGSPRQEIWIDRNRARLGAVRLFMGLGGTLDVFSGDVRRAPEWMGKMGFEWLWRMVGQPKRFRDVPKLTVFSGRMLAAAMKNLSKCTDEWGQAKPF